MPRYSIQHITRYDYHYPVAQSHHSFYLEPKSLPTQSCESFSIVTDPEMSFCRTRIDYFGNPCGLFSIEQDHDILTIEAESIVDLNKSAPNLSLYPITLGEYEKAIQNKQNNFEPWQYLYGSEIVKSEPSDEILQYAKNLFQPNKSVVAGCSDLMQDIKNNFIFDPEATDIYTTVEDFFQLKRGVCQDFAHFSISVLQSVGLAARYVNGYILTHPAPGKERLEGADASHAWVSVYIPNYGWLDFDPTNNLFCADEHITVAWGRDFKDISMIRGATRGGGDHDLDVSVTVKPI